MLPAPRPLATVRLLVAATRQRQGNAALSMPQCTSWSLAWSKFRVAHGSCSSSISGPYHSRQRCTVAAGHGDASRPSRRDGPSLGSAAQPWSGPSRACTSFLVPAAASAAAAVVARPAGTVPTCYGAGGAGVVTTMPAVLNDSAATGTGTATMGGRAAVMLQQQQQQPGAGDPPSSRADDVPGSATLSPPVLPHTAQHAGPHARTAPGRQRAPAEQGPLSVSPIPGLPAAESWYGQRRWTHAAPPPAPDVSPLASAAPWAFSVMCYNLLADQYVSI